MVVNKRKQRIKRGRAIAAWTSESSSLVGDSEVAQKLNENMDLASQVGDSLLEYFEKNPYTDPRYMYEYQFELERGTFVSEEDVRRTQARMKNAQTCHGSSLPRHCDCFDLCDACLSHWRYKGSEALFNWLTLNYKEGLYLVHREEKFLLNRGVLYKDDGTSLLLDGNRQVRDYQYDPEENPFSGKLKTMAFYGNTFDCTFKDLRSIFLPWLVGKRYTLSRQLKPLGSMSRICILPRSKFTLEVKLMTYCLVDEKGIRRLPKLAKKYTDWQSSYAYLKKWLPAVRCEIKGEPIPKGPFFGKFPHKIFIRYEPLEINASWTDAEVKDLLLSKIEKAFPSHLCKLSYFTPKELLYYQIVWLKEQGARLRMTCTAGIFENKELEYLPEV